MKDPNQKGSVGEFAIAKDLVRKGYHIFNSMTKHSKTDLVVLTPDYKQCIKVQIKTTTAKSGYVNVETRKRCLNPKYNSNYKPEHADVFAVYIEDRDIVFFISQKEFLANKASIKYRFRDSPPKKGEDNSKYVEDRLVFPY